MSTRRGRYYWLAAVPVVLAAGFFLLRNRGDGVRYATGTIDRGDIVEVVGATGALEAVTTVQVGSQVSGTIQSIHADFNSVVKKDQVIARLDPSLFEARLGQAKANLQAAKANVDRARAAVEDTRQKYQRARELAEQTLLAETDLETAKSNYDAALAQLKANEAAQSQAQANVNQAEVDLSHTIITTPIDGVVISRNVDVGQTVAASFQAPVLFVIANDLARMRVNASVDEADVGRVREGQSVLFHVDAFPERDFWGRVEQVRLNPTTVSNVVTYNTIVAVDNENLLLRPGMTATVSIQVRKAENALRLPAAALRFRPEGFERPSAPAGGGRPAASAQAQGPAGASGRPEAGRGGSPGTGVAMAAPASQQGETARPTGAGQWRSRGERQGAASAGASDPRPGLAGQGGPGQWATRGDSGGMGAAGAGGAGRRGRPTTVFVLDERGLPKALPVVVGISDGQFVEVREGLEEGATVITGTEIPGAARAGGPRPGSSPTTNPFQPRFQRRQR